MSDKSRLEKDLEKRELVRRPIGAFVLISILSVSLGALGVYTFKLKQELTMKENEIALMRSDFDKGKASLLNRIKRLEGGQKYLESDSELLIDKSSPVSEEAPSLESFRETDEE